MYLLQIVAIGLCSMFELVKETQSSHPELCCRALTALLNVLQGQHPEALKNESPTVIGRQPLMLQQDPTLH